MSSGARQHRSPDQRAIVAAASLPLMGELLECLPPEHELAVRRNASPVSKRPPQRQVQRFRRADTLDAAVTRGPEQPGVEKRLQFGQRGLEILRRDAALRDIPGRRINPQEPGHRVQHRALAVGRNRFKNLLQLPARDAFQRRGTRRVQGLSQRQDAGQFGPAAFINRAVFRGEQDESGSQVLVRFRQLLDAVVRADRQRFPVGMEWNIWDAKPPERHIVFAKGRRKKRLGPRREGVAESAPLGLLTHLDPRRHDHVLQRPAARRHQLVANERLRHAHHAVKVADVGRTEGHDDIRELSGAHAAHLGYAGSAIDEHDVIGAVSRHSEPFEEFFAMTPRVQVVPSEVLHRFGVPRKIRTQARRQQREAAREGARFAQPDGVGGDRRQMALQQCEDLGGAGRAGEDPEVGSLLQVGMKQIDHADPAPYRLCFLGLQRKVVLQARRLEIPIDEQDAQSLLPEPMADVGERHRAPHPALVGVEREYHHAVLRKTDRGLCLGSAWARTIVLSSRLMSNSSPVNTLQVA